MVLSLKQTGGLMDLTQWPRLKSTHLRTPDFSIKKPKLYNGKKKASLENGTDITGCVHVEECK